MITTGNNLNRFENVTVTVSGGGTQFNFPDQPNLRGVPIDCITTYYFEQIPQTPNGQNLLYSLDLASSFLVLYVKDEEYIRIPMTHLVNNYTPAGGLGFINGNGYIPLGGLNIIWSKSYVKYPTANPLLEGAFMFGVFYKK